MGFGCVMLVSFCFSRSLVLLLFCRGYRPRQACGLLESAALPGLGASMCHFTQIRGGSTLPYS
jgi:hypothetical protein